jgi:hypothetical protein
VSAEDQPAVPDAPDKPEPETTGTEQPTIESKSFSSELLKVAAEEGHQVGDTPPPVVEAKPEPEPEVEEEVPETETEPETEEEEKPAAEHDKMVPLREVMAERDKKRRANDRAERAEALAEQLKAQLSQAVTPAPTEDDPFRDIIDPAALDRLERSYEKSLDLAEEDPDALVAQYVEIEKKKSGVDLLEKFTPEQLLAITKRKAERAVRKQIPERRTYLQQRAVADAEAYKIYPELQDPNSEFTQAAAFLAQKLINGQALKDPTVLQWIGHAVRGWQESQKNGSDAVENSGAKKIVKAARQQVAPTPTRTRSFVERGSSSVNLEKAKEKFEQAGTTDAAEELVAALLSGSGQSKKVEPIGE